MPAGKVRPGLEAQAVELAGGGERGGADAVEGQMLLHLAAVERIALAAARCSA